MEEEKVHLNKVSYNSNKNIYLMFLPIIAFILSLLIILSYLHLTKGISLGENNSPAGNLINK